MTVLDQDANLQDVPRQGIRDVNIDWLRASNRDGRVRLVSSAVRRTDGGYDLCVAPTALPEEHPLGRLGAKQMGITYRTDLFGTITSIIDEPTPLPSAATMLRDLLAIYVAGRY